MRVLEELFKYLEIDDRTKEVNKAFKTFIKVLVVMIMLVVILAWSLLVYNLITCGMSEGISFGLIDKI